jgi:hypothetical protein
MDPDSTDTADAEEMSRREFLTGTWLKDVLIAAFADQESQSEAPASSSSSGAAVPAADDD